MYSESERKQVQDLIISQARKDHRITDAAIVGSESIGTNDRWSDIDLSFGFSESSLLEELLNDWTRFMNSSFNANTLFDLEYRNSMYRVYLLPNALQVDLSFTPSKDFGAITEKFKLLFGKAKPKGHKSLPDENEVFGYAVLYALKTRCSLERGKPWQTAYFLNQLRENILVLHCLKENLDPFEGRGYDLIPLNTKKALEPFLKSEMTNDGQWHILKSLILELHKISAAFESITYKFTSELHHISEKNE